MHMCLVKVSSSYLFCQIQFQYVPKPRGEAGFDMIQTAHDVLPINTQQPLVRRLLNGFWWLLKSNREEAGMIGEGHTLLHVVCQAVKPLLPMVLP